MERYSPEVDRFIREYVLPKLNFVDYDYENISDIVEFIDDKYEGPLANAEECGEILSEEDKKCWILRQVL